MRENNPLGGKPPANPFVAAVRVQLALAGVPASQMARLINVPIATFARRMAGDNPFSADELVAIAVQLRVPVSLLFAEAEAAAIAERDQGAADALAEVGVA